MNILIGLKEQLINLFVTSCMLQTMGYNVGMLISELVIRGSRIAIS